MGAKDPHACFRKVMDFFESNQDEELTRSDIQVKFDLSETQADSVLRRLMKEGFIESHHVYRMAKS